jgi:DNA-binding PadR family transcriptional regulator
VAQGKSSDLSLADWVVLGVVAEGPTYGWPIVRELSADGGLGAVWTVPRPIVYRSISTLIAEGLLETSGDAPGVRGPRRTIVRVTQRGRRALRSWLARPVDHVRDVRSEFLIKLALLGRSGRPHRELVQRQLDELAPVFSALQRPHDGDEFCAVLNRWRREQARAVERFLRSLLDD